MIEKEETIYQSFNESEQQLQYLPECLQCRQMQEYIYKLEQEVQELNKRLSQQEQRVIRSAQNLSYCKQQPITVKVSQHHRKGLVRSLHEESDFYKSNPIILSQAHQKKKIFEDNRTSSNALQFYKI